MFYYGLEETPYKRKREGVQVKAISGQRCQMLLVRLDPGFVSDHAHDEEQIGYVRTGTISLTVGGETKTCKPGDGYCIPPGARHSFRVTGDEPAEIIDIFSPPKKENIL